MIYREIGTLDSDVRNVLKQYVPSSLLQALFFHDSEITMKFFSEFPPLDPKDACFKPKVAEVHEVSDRDWSFLSEQLAEGYRWNED